MIILECSLTIPVTAHYRRIQFCFTAPDLKILLTSRIAAFLVSRVLAHAVRERLKLPMCMDQMTGTSCFPVEDPNKWIHILLMKLTNFSYGFYRMLITISVGVIISCLLSSVLVLICCFCQRCPLYSVCHSKYQHNDTIAFCKFLKISLNLATTFCLNFFLKFQPPKKN